MPGHQHAADGTFITRRKRYREGVVEADVLGPTDPNIPILNTKIVEIGPSNTGENHHGKDARIYAYCLFNGVANAVIELWILADLDPFPNVGNPDRNGDWALVQSNYITTSAMIKFLDIPPSQFKILISSIEMNPEMPGDRPQPYEPSSDSSSSSKSSSSSSKSSSSSSSSSSPAPRGATLLVQFSG